MMPIISFMYEVTKPLIFSKEWRAELASDGPHVARHPKSQLWLPKLSLSACVLAFFCRDTTGVELSREDRFSHFPAVPACSLTWVISGEMAFIRSEATLGSGTHHMPMPDRISLLGPLTRPLLAWNPGMAHVFVLMLRPDAFHAMTGLEPGGFINRTVPACSVLSPEWMDLCRAVQHAPDDLARVDTIERFLDEAWTHRQDSSASTAQLIKDWAQGLAVRAATTGLGRSLRQAERRIKQWTGQPMREIHGIARMELALFDALSALERGAVNWLDVAASGGYSDQSHLCRQTRQLTGFTPLELQRRITNDESLWFYRLWSGIPKTRQGLQAQLQSQLLAKGSLSP
jgi:AraC-like DNA-binding protein